VFLVCHAWHKLSHIRPSSPCMRFSGFAHERAEIQNGSVEECRTSSGANV
jgi:hypothetical protein